MLYITKKFSMLFVGMMMECTHFDVDVLFEYEEFLCQLSVNHQARYLVWCQLEDG